MTHDHKNLNENRIYKQGYAYGKSGASRSQYEPIKRLLPARLQSVFELGRTDGFLDSIKEAKK